LRPDILVRAEVCEEAIVLDGGVAYSLGVDLGTTFVAAAVARGSRVEMATLGDRTVVTPAVVYTRDDGTLVTGETANRRAVSNPDRVGREFKRRLGDPTPVMLGGAPHAVTSLLAALLADTVAKVTETEGAPPQNVVLSHPANWGPYRRELFEEVPRLAGVPQARMITEPEAAAAHYAAARHLADGDTVAVYDLGGGTFDATVLRKRAVGIDILGTPEGIERLGGVDFDDAILAHINVSSSGALSELDLSNPQTAVALARLRQDAVLAKEALSIDTEATIPVFLPNRHFEVRLTRGEFEDMIRAQIESTIGALTRTLRSAHIEPADLNAVLLVGGSSRIPLVAQMITAALNRPTLVDVHPKYAVALGAAALAAELGTPSGNGDGAGHPPAAAPAELFTPAVPAVPAPGAAPVGALAPAAALSAGWIGGPAADGGPATGPFAAVGTPTRPEAAPPGPEAPAEPYHEPRHEPPYDGQYDQRYGAPPAEPFVAPGNGHGGWPPPPVPDHGGDAGGPPPQSGPPHHLGPPPLAPATGTPRRRRGPVIAAAVAVLVLLVGAITYVVLRPTGGPGVQAGAVPSPILLPPPAPRPTEQQPSIAASRPIPAVAGEIPVGNTPGFVAIAPSGSFAYVANRAAGVVTVVDTAIDKVVATIPIPDGPPQYLAFSPDGSRLYVSVFNDPDRSINRVAVLDTQTNTVLTTIKVGTRPYALAVNPDGSEIYVPNHDSGTVSVIETKGNTLVTDIRVKPNPHWADFSKDGTRAYTANHESNLISIIDTGTRAVVAEVPVERSPHSVAVHPTMPLVVNVNYDSDSVSVIDTNTEKVVATVPVGTHPQDVTWAADGRHFYVTNVDGDTMTVIARDGYKVTATIPTGEAPTSIAVLPDGTKGYVSNLNTGTLTVLDLTG
jgi:YVTN family beta-propeller protein